MMFFDIYKNEYIPKLKQQLGQNNVMALPRLHKIVVSCSTSEALTDIKVLDKVSKDLSFITGQKPVIRRAKKDIANFKLRKGNPVGCVVTLRKKKMYEFFNRLVNVALPRVRDFRGVSAKGFDGHGNFSLGVKEHIIFPEIDFDSVDKVRGLTVTMVTTAPSDEQCRVLLEVLGMPFRKDKKNG
ncbi:MAG: 50S ribosomal protein L5 [Deltaproteobacteria bacterium]|nr:50S ribosomal protein L5 [Deltaproteobacteria bacterium]